MPPPYVGDISGAARLSGPGPAQHFVIGKPSKSGGTSFHSLYVYKNTGVFRDEAAGERDDLIELFVFLLHCSKKEAIDAARILAGREHPYTM